jgi:hypothetical protein
MALVIIDISVTINKWKTNLLVAVVLDVDRGESLSPKAKPWFK